MGSDDVRRFRTILRYALLGTLLREGRPVGVTELIATVSSSRPIERRVGPLTRKRVADLLRHHVDRGSVVRVASGRYLAVPSTFSPTTRSRYEHWERCYDLADDPSRARCARRCGGGSRRRRAP